MNEIEFAEWVDWAERRALESFAGEGLGGQLLGKPADFVMLHLPDRTLIRLAQAELDRRLGRRGVQVVCMVSQPVVTPADQNGDQ